MFMVLCILVMNLPVIEMVLTLAMTTTNTHLNGVTRSTIRDIMEIILRLKHIEMKK